ncbi:MAG: D-alanine--D-alanine ligase [Lachnospiraceae bacterium]|nr:D-alanine--D-alanine ligase [Lachnospiraceae bacterium]
MNKKLVCVIFGGESSEHDVSCISATTVINNIDRDIYDVMLIGITKDGRWLLVDDVSCIKDGSFANGDIEAVILPDKYTQGVLVHNKNDKENPYYVKHVDVIFPVLHGLYGEDGTIQGVFEMAGIPYVGCGVLASSVGMDKLTTKKVVESLGHIDQARYVAVFKEDFSDLTEKAGRIESELGYPVFVKPSNAGSSMGVSKASTREELYAALSEALLHDDRILVEEAIYGREIECAVLGDGDVKASGLGEILAAAEFYDFDAKYNNEESKTVIDPDLPAEVVDNVRKFAADIFRAISGKGLSRVDFFVENKTDRIIFNEINTLPGFTEISMYPMLWEAKGIDRKALVSKLIESAECRFARKK